MLSCTCGLDAAIAAHVEVQRPGKVLTFPDGCEVTPDQLVHAARKAIEQMQFDVRPTREWGREAREAIDAFNGVVSMFERQVKLAPAQPLSAQQVFDVVEEFIKQEAERVGTDQPTGLEYPVGHRHWNNMIADLRERLNKLIG